MDEVIDNAAADSTPVSSGSTSALGAMEKAAASVSSTEGTPGAVTGDTTEQGGSGKAVAISDATGQPVPEGSAAATAARGEAPQSRIEAAVKNARAEVEAKFAWAKDIPATVVPDLKTGYQLVKDLRKDPKAFALQLCSELGISIAPEKQEAPAKPWDMPKPDLHSEDGKGAYSADVMQEILTHALGQLREELTGQMKPVLDRHKSEAQQRQEYAIQLKSTQDAKEVLTDARKLPHFTEANEPAILAKLQAIPLELKQKLGGGGSLMLAYNRFLAESVFPTYDTAAEQRVRDSNAKKAATSAGSAHPSDQGGEGKRKPVREGDVQGLAARMREMEASASA